MFLNSQMGAMNMAMPDVCKTPVPPAGPVPMPYPNSAQSTMANPSTASKKVMVANAPAHSLKTVVTLSMGDNAGVAGGVMSSKMMGECRHSKGSMKVMIEGQPATRLTDMTMQNAMPGNSVGATIKPAQTKVLAPS
ncbi:MAG: DUF4150 domain-containing protein [Reinekea forsetii]|nr:DUF4150 domain-containing protein [Reinekea forsetii]